MPGVSYQNAFNAREWLAAMVLALLLAGSGSAQTQRRPMDVPSPTGTDVVTGRTRLILKDGSYQLVLSYTVVGDLVRYRSAERNGEPEEIPLKLVDLPATERWAKEHGPDAEPQPAQQQRPPVLSPELQKEEADRAARMPEVAPDLRLPEVDSVLALDTFRGTPELVPLPQDGSDLNKETAHSVQRLAINPASAAHRILDLAGIKADIQLHVAEPVVFVRVGLDEPQDPTGPVFTVDTGGTNGRPTPSGGSAASGYVVERLDVRYDSRQVDSFRLGLLGSGKPQPDVIECKSEVMPGGHWLKVTPAQPLTFGEYALIEVLDDRSLNLNVWSFGVHPTAVENVEAIKPEPKRPATLEHRRP